MLSKITNLLQKLYQSIVKRFCDTSKGKNMVNCMLP